MKKACNILITVLLLSLSKMHGAVVPLANNEASLVVANQEQKKSDALISQGFLQELSSMFSDKKVHEQLQNNARAIRFSCEDEEEGLSNHGELKKQCFDFYQNYISQYYPKVFVIRSLFEAMAVDEVEQSLRDVIMLFARQPWFYFVNEQGSFSTPMYWEYIVDQCSFMNDFLQQARVDLTTKKIMWDNGNLHTSSYGMHFRNFMRRGRAAQRAAQTKSLYLYLKGTAKGCIYDFYALCFDFLIKLFNEGILLKDSKQAQRYLYELEFVVERLRGSRYEADYQEAVKVCKELLSRLKKILNSQELYNDEHDETHYDDRTNKMVKEAKELGYV